MAEEEEKEQAAGTEETPPQKSPLKWIIIGCVVIVLGVGGFLGWRMFAGKSNASDGGEQAKVEKAAINEKKIVYPLEPFIVNLVDKAGLGKRYLKVTLELEVGSDEAKKSINTHQSQLRDTILLLLSGLSFNEISSIEGKLDLKQALLSRINQVLGGGIVRRIYFTEFVVQ